MHGFVGSDPIILFISDYKFIGLHSRPELRLFKRVVRAYCELVLTISELFGWGKSKTIQLQVKKSDTRNRNHVQDQEKYTRPYNNQKQQQVLFEEDEDDYFQITKSALGGSPSQNTDDEKLQDTIRFVFSLEQEGLLTIGTFALEQLAAIHDSRHHLKSASDGFQSCANWMQSSDDDLDISSNSPCDFPSDLAESDAEDTQVVDPKALTLCQGIDRSPVAGTKPTIRLTALPPELQRALDPAVANPWLLHRKSPSYPPHLGHWTDSARPPNGVLPKASVEQDVYPSYFCGLFSSKKRSSLSEKTKRMSPLKKFAPTAIDESHKFEFEFATDGAEQKTKKSRRNVGTNRGLSLENLAKLWRSSCLQSNARIAPERKPYSPRASHAYKDELSNGIPNGVVLTTPSTSPCDPVRPRSWIPREDCCPKLAEFTRTVAINETSMGRVSEAQTDGESDGGHWIKTDSEYVVLEM